jgi:tetratricopeptide (TPR) repeat protein
MSGGAGGSILSMIISLKNNKMLLGKRRSHKEIREQYRSKLIQHKKNYQHADPLVIKKIRKELIRERKKETIKRYVILAVSLVAVFIILTFILINTYNFPDSKPAEQDIIDSKIRDFNIFMNYGDYRFQNKEYEQAIVEYQQALKIFPNDYNANIALANLYFTICVQKDSLCTVALKTYNSLLMKFDTSAFLLSKRADLLIHLGDFEKASSDLDRIMKLP